MREAVGKAREVGLDLADSSGNEVSPAGQQELRRGEGVWWLSPKQVRELRVAGDLQGCC